MIINLLRAPGRKRAMSFPTKDDLIRIYRRRARRYDLTSNLYYLIGARVRAYRKMVVKTLGLCPEDTVVEIGCGTGLNFPLLQKEIGPRGKIIGVDLTDAMLEKARRRVSDEESINVELINIDAASFLFPTGIDGIISTFAITLIPEYDEIIRRGCEALSPGKRWVVLDIKMPSNRLSFLAPLLAPIIKPFGGTLEMAERRPWESIDKYMKHTSFAELYMGIIYIAAGERGEECC